MSKSENPVSERIKILLDVRSGGNKSELGRAAGISGQGIADLIGGKKGGPSFAVLQNILRSFPDLNERWLIFGEGQMLESADTNAEPQKISSYPPDQNNAHAIKLLSDIPLVELPHVSFKARASFNYTQLQRHMNADIFDTVLHRLPLGKTLEDYKDAVVFDIEGDSMEPTLQSGQQVIAWPVAESKWEYLHNTVCVVDYDDTVTVKAVYSNDLNNTEGLTLHATGGKGGSFVVAREHIHSIWEVREFYGVVPVRLLP